MHFGSPALFTLLIAAGLTAAGSLWLLQWQVRQIERFRGAGGGKLLTRWSRRQPLVKAGLLVIAVALLAVAAARPQVGATEAPLRQEGIAIVLAIDVSVSMAAQDLPPDRLSVVRDEVGGLLSRLQGDLVGLVVFAGTAFPRFPLTRDLPAAKVVIDALRPGVTLVEPGSNGAAAITAATALLESSEARTNTIVLISDGEFLEGDAVAAAANAAATGIYTFTVGAATAAGATIPVRSPTFEPAVKIDATTQEPVVSRLDADVLQEIARAGGGRYLALDHPGALSDVAADFDALEATAFAVRTDTLPVERYQIVAGIALALLLFEPLIAAALPVRRPRSVWRRLALAAGLPSFALLLAGCAGATFSHNQAGNAAFARGDYARALGEYRAAQAATPADPRLHLNAGRALHALGEFDRAITATRSALTADDPALRARAHYHLGNHFLAQGDLVNARNAYIEALLIDPTDIDAKFNLELVVVLLQRQAEAAEARGGASTEPTEQGAPLDIQATGDQSGSASGLSAPVSSGQSTPPPDTAAAAGQQVLEQRAANLSLRAALAELDRDAPTLAQALTVLDALRARHSVDRLTVGSRPTTVVGNRDW